MVPTRYGRQAIRLSSKVLGCVFTSALIDSNRVVDVKRAVLGIDVLCIGQVRRSCIHVETFYHTQSILLYGQAARAISIG